MAVSDRVQEALIKLEERDINNALIQLSIAVDATAKKMFPQLKNSQRIKSFLKAKSAFIWWTLLNGIPNSNGEFCFSFADEGFVSIEDIMYKYIRCNLLHEGEAPANILFDYVEYFKVNSDGSLILPVCYLYSILWAVISSAENENQKMAQDFYVYFGAKKSNLNDYWGDEVGMKDAIRNGFEYDCEAILKQFKE